MIRKIKMWLYERFLPWVTKEQYMKDMQGLLRANKELKQENKVLTAYIEGMEYALRRGIKVEIKNEAEKR